MSPCDTAIIRLRRQIAAFLMLKESLLWLTAWLFLWGTGVLVLRVTAGTAPILLLWGLAAAPFVLAGAIVHALRKMPARAAVSAVVDKAGGCGGLLMASEEQPLGDWQATMPAIGDLRVRWRGGRSWAVFSFGVLFVAIGLLLPQHLASMTSNPALEIGKEADKLASQIEVLKEEAILEPNRADSLKEKLQQLKEEASGTNPVKTLEALDHLQDIVVKAAREAAETAVGKTEKLAKAETLAEGMNKAGELSPKIKREAMAELASLVKKAAEETGLVDKHLDAKTLKDFKAGSLSAEQLKKLAEALKGSKKDLADLLDKLREAKLIDPDLLAKCEKAGKCDSSGLAALLKKHGDKMTVCDLMKMCAGKGGLDEGPGAAAMTWGEKTKEDVAKFKEEVLPPAALADLKKNKLVALGQENPTVDKTGGKSKSGALNQASAGGGSANTPIILPRHRGAVERYFARPTTKEK